MNDELRKFSQAIIQGVNQAGPASSIPALSAYFKAPLAAPLTNSAVSGQNVAIGQKADDDAKAAEAARQAKIQSLQDQLDPSKYYKVRKNDGGFDFYDPTGKRIDVSTYASRTGQDRDQILKNSDNPIDQEFVNDYGNMRDLVNASNNRDAATVAAYAAQNKDLKINYDKNTGQINNINDLLKQLIAKYPHLYNAGSYNQTYSNRNQRLFGSNGGGSAGGGLAGLAGS